MPLAYYANLSKKGFATTCNHCTECKIMREEKMSKKGKGLNSCISLMINKHEKMHIKNKGDDNITTEKESVQAQRRYMSGKSSWASVISVNAIKERNKKARLAKKFNMVIIKVNNTNKIIITFWEGDIPSCLKNGTLDLMPKVESEGCREIEFFSLINRIVSMDAHKLFLTTMVIHEAKQVKEQ